MPLQETEPKFSTSLHNNVFAQNSVESVIYSTMENFERTPLEAIPAAAAVNLQTTPLV